MEKRQIVHDSYHLEFDCIWPGAAPSIRFTEQVHKLKLKRIQNSTIKSNWNANEMLWLSIIAFVFGVVQWCGGEASGQCLDVPKNCAWSVSMQISLDWTFISWRFCLIKNLNVSLWMRQFPVRSSTVCNLFGLFLLPRWYCLSKSHAISSSFSFNWINLFSILGLCSEWCYLLLWFNSWIVEYLFVFDN